MRLKTLRNAVLSKKAQSLESSPLKVETVPEKLTPPQNHSRSKILSTLRRLRNPRNRNYNGMRIKDSKLAPAEIKRRFKYMTSPATVSLLMRTPRVTTRTVPRPKVRLSSQIQEICQPKFSTTHPWISKKTCLPSVAILIAENTITNPQRSHPLDMMKYPTSSQFQK